jgi:hypothetical protein
MTNAVVTLMGGALFDMPSVLQRFRIVERHKVRKLGYADFDGQSVQGRWRERHQHHLHGWGVSAFMRGPGVPQEAWASLVPQTAPAAASPCCGRREWRPARVEAVEGSQCAILATVQFQLYFFAFCTDMVRKGGITLRSYAAVM